MTKVMIGVIAVLGLSLLTAGWQLKRAWAESATLEANWQSAEQALEAEQARAAQLEADAQRLDQILVERDRRTAQLAQRTTALQQRLTEAQDNAGTDYQRCRDMPLPGAGRLRDATRASGDAD